jgi:hypothetical protein
MPRPRKPEDKKKKKVSITLDAQLLEDLKKAERREGLSLSEFIEHQLKTKTHWDIQEFGKLIHLINTYNGEKVDYYTYINPYVFSTNILPYSLYNKKVSIEFLLKNSKGGLNKHKLVIDYGFCWDCPGHYIDIKLYGWDDKKEEWFEMGESSLFTLDGEKIFNEILKIRRDFWLKLKTFREEKKRKKRQKD